MTKKKKKILIISGPTATGKTALSMHLAQKFHLPIVNADSLLFYKELTIGVAKPSKEDLDRIPHHLINITSIAQPINAKIYRDLAIKTFENLWCEKNYDALILVGGSGFYIKALLYGMYESETPSPSIVEKSQALYDKDGISPFIEILKEHDPTSYKKLHINDHYRIRRAVEHWWYTNIAFSEVSIQQDKKNLINPFWKTQGWEYITLYTDVNKNQHQRLIEERTSSMLKSGLIEEVQQLLKSFTGKEKPLQSIGYKEVQDFLNSKLKTIEELEMAINISTRQLAKAQRTWFKNLEKHSLHFPEFINEAEVLCQNFLV